jgi:BirA family biotin operon repressor/biotin-[acetyl-CoA-carboxylase] ligase
LLRLLTDGEFHSGEVLAKQLGVSRASVNIALRNIDQYGLTLFSVRGRGYRLVNAPQWLDAEKVRAGLKTPEKFHIEIVDSAVSSNTVLMQRAALGATGGDVLAVEWQSAGRGRLGRAWHSGLGNALTFSLLWRFSFGLSALTGLSLAVGVAMMRTLRKAGVAGVGLKWPNDVLTGVPVSLTPTLSPGEREQTNRCANLSIPRQGKLAGILIEAQGDMLGPSVVVIGIGLNLRLPEEIAQRIDQPVSDLVHAVAELPERNHLLALLLQELADMLGAFAQHGFTPLRAEWESYHVYQNRQVKMLLPDGTQVAGIARGVTNEGALRVETEHGEQVFNAGEISLRGA